MDQSSFQKQPGLTRYRSAPSSYFSSLLSFPYARDEFQNARASTADIEQVFATFVATIGNPHSNSLDKFNRNDFVVPKQEDMFISSVKQEPEILQNPASVDNSMAAVDNSFTFMTSTNNMGGGSSNLTRYNSSPAGFLATFNIENEYGGLSTSKRLKTQVGGKPPTAPRLMPGDKGILEESSNTNNEDFPELSWEDSHILSDDFLKAPEDNESEPFSNNNSEGVARPLTHHLSMPTSSMEKLLPLNVRAKRGCATHPRSIAERVRRTRISERMRKLQQLVPNMDKQTNTADMLDFAVDYIKHLEKQVKLLEERRAKCTCTDK